jgi:hypothetical protein
LVLWLFSFALIAPAGAAAPSAGAAAPAAAKEPEKPKVEEVDALDGGTSLMNTMRSSIMIMICIDCCHLAGKLLRLILSLLL